MIARRRWFAAHCTRRRGRWSFWFVVIVASLLGYGVAFSSSVHAHAELVQALPQPNAELSEAPRQLVLTFSEPLNAKLSQVVIEDSQGKSTTNHKVEFSSDEPHVMRLNLPPRVPNGVYTVKWTTVSTLDGHILRGSYLLFIGVPAGEAAVSAAAPRPDAGPTSMAVRWIAWAGLTLWLGAVIWLGFIIRPDATHAAVARSTCVWLRRSPIIVLFGWTLDIVLQAHSATGGDWRALLGPAVWEGMLLSSNHGKLMIGRWVLMLLAMLLPWLTYMLGPIDDRWPRFSSPPREEARRQARLQLALAIVIFGFTAAAGHAATITSVPTSAILFDALHLLASLGWAGGMILAGWVAVPLLSRRPRANMADRHVQKRAATAKKVLFVVETRQTNPALSMDDLIELTRRFAPWALAGFVATMLTGWLNTELQVSNLEALMTTTYGKLLQLKLAFVAVVVLFSGIHAYWLRPRLERALRPSAAADGTLVSEHTGVVPSGVVEETPKLHPRMATAWLTVLRVEPIFALAILAVVAVLTTYPPAKMTWEARPEVIGVPPAVSGALRLDDAAGAYRINLSVYPAAIGPNTFEILLLDKNDRPIEQAFVRLRLISPKEDLGREFITMEELKDGRYRGYGSFTGSGDWTVETIVRVPGDEEVRTNFRFAMPVPDVKALIVAADRAMNELKYLHERHELGPGVYGIEITEIDYAAPGKVSYVRTNSGDRMIAIGADRYDLAAGDSHWQHSPWPGVEPLVWPNYNWAANAEEAVIIGEDTVQGVECWVVAFRAPSYNGAYRLWIGKQDYLVYQERMIATGHYMTSIYSNFNVPVVIEKPEPVVPTE